MPSISINEVKKAFSSLELAPTADKKSIKKKSLALLMHLHTDRTGLSATAESEQRTRAINEAREILLSTLSEQELSDFVSQLNHSTSTASLVSNASREKSLGHTITIPSVIRIINRPEPKSFVSVYTVHSEPEASFSSGWFGSLFGGVTPPAEPEPEPIRALTALCLGNEDSGKSGFFDAAFKNYESRTEFKVVTLDKVKYYWYCLAGQERFRAITESYYDRANIMAFFGDDYASVRNWISTSQTRLTQHQQQEEQPELYYVSYVNGTLNLQPWGEITENDFNHQQTQQKIPSEHVHQFMTQFYNKINDILQSENPHPNRARIQGGPRS